MTKSKPRKYQWQNRMVGTYCTICQKHTTGNGSELRPYRCKCGIWLYDVVTKQFSLVK